MISKVFDINRQHGLALVQIEGKSQYVNLAPLGDPAIEEIPFHHLNQHHLVARSTIRGLTSDPRPMLAGWLRYELLEGMFQRQHIRPR